MSGDWLVVGISGATCSGKTTLAKKLHENLKNSIVIYQDEYFLPPDDPRHVWVPEVGHFNWDSMTSLDMKKMIEDVKKIVGSRDENINGEVRVLILEGFLIFNCPEIAEICDLRYFLDMRKDECWERRKSRVYDPPDVPNYFEKVVWPEFEKSRSEILGNRKLAESVQFMDGTMNKEETFLRVFRDVENKLRSK